MVFHEFFKILIIFILRDVEAAEGITAKEGRCISKLACHTLEQVDITTEPDVANTKQTSTPIALPTATDTPTKTTSAKPEDMPATDNAAKLEFDLEASTSYVSDSVASAEPVDTTTAEPVDIPATTTVAATKQASSVLGIVVIVGIIMGIVGRVVLVRRLGGKFRLNN